MKALWRLVIAIGAGLAFGVYWSDQLRQPGPLDDAFEFVYNSLCQHLPVSPTNWPGLATAALLYNLPILLVGVLFYSLLSWPSRRRLARIIRRQEAQEKKPKCSKCLRHSPQGAKFCAFCGAKL